jgi:ankyrin repeat protein
VGYDAEQGCFVIEGYTASLAKPAMVEKVLYRLPGPPPPAPPTNAAPAPDRTELNNALLEASLSGATGTVAALLTQGADVNARSSEGGTPLMYACASGHVQTVQLLLAAGADVQARASDPNAWPVIMVAAQNGAPEIMKLLLEKGADPNTVDPSRNTPLMLAALRGHAQVVELLIRAGANLNAQETKRRNFPLLYAVSRGHAAIAEVLICNGAKVNLCDQSGMTALMSCAENGNTEIAASLLKTNANLEAKLTGEVGAGATALMLAAAKGQEGMVRLL